MARSALRSLALAIVASALIAAPALAQTPAATVTETVRAKAPPPWTFYMAILTIALAGLTLILAVLGYLVQAPGFRRKERTPASAPGPGQAS